MGYPIGFEKCTDQPFLAQLDAGYSCRLRSLLIQSFMNFGCQPWFHGRPPVADARANCTPSVSRPHPSPAPAHRTSSWRLSAFRATRLWVSPASWRTSSDAPIARQMDACVTVPWAWPRWSKASNFTSARSTGPLQETAGRLRRCVPDQLAYPSNGLHARQ
jgi:hypothetical protein